MLNIKVRYLLLANYLNLFSFAFFTPLFALFVLDISAKPEIIGLAWGVNMYAAAFMILLFGRYENHKRNMERMIVLGYFILAIGALAYLLVDNIWQLFLVQILNALGVGILTPAWRTVYARSEDKGRETLEWSFVDGGGRFFAATGAIVGSVVFKYSGFTGLFIFISALQLVAACISLRLLRAPQS